MSGIDRRTLIGSRGKLADATDVTTTGAAIGSLLAATAVSGGVPTAHGYKTPAALTLVTSTAVARLIAVPQGDVLPTLADGDLVVRYTLPGALYYTDFSAYTTAAKPSDWSEPWVAGTWTVEADAAATGGKVLRHTAGTTGRRALTWNAIDADALRADVEVLYKWRTTDVNIPAAAVLRVSGAAATETGYRVGPFNASTTEIGKYVNGTYTALGNNAEAWTTNTWFLTRTRIQGSTIQTKTWLATDTEPVAWERTITDTSITAAGKVGLMNANIATRDYDWFAAATAGRTAAQQ